MLHLFLTGVLLIWPHFLNMCKDCLTIVMILAFAGILTAVFAGLVSGVTGNLFFKSYLVLFEVFSPFSFFWFGQIWTLHLQALCTLCSHGQRHFSCRVCYSQKHDIGTAFFSTAPYIPMNVFYAHFCTLSKSFQQEFGICISSSEGLVFKPVWHSSWDEIWGVWNMNWAISLSVDQAQND